MAGVERAAVMPLAIAVTRYHVAIAGLREEPVRVVRERGRMVAARAERLLPSLHRQWPDVRVLQAQVVHGDVRLSNVCRSRDGGRSSSLSDSPPRGLAYMTSPTRWCSPGPTG